ncbi:MFS transporter [Dictyobacter formicarum]|uniref:MFS transporter n=1 Tax=Dictyobacter formicarum TaxID=2778368 RepID=A0ABQ3VEE0_9CHLR|nr:MFS transporter [Dictyobacter formicarum]GHO84109.1 MFS transporter [Dictyobacter formicarum]
MRPPQQPAVHQQPLRSLRLGELEKLRERAVANEQPVIQQGPHDHTTPGAGAGPPRLPSLYYGWVLVITLGLTTIISYGTTQYLFGVLVVPISHTFHWNRTSISGAYALGSFIAGILGIPVGFFIDRQGARLLMTCGSLLAGITFIGLSMMQQVWQFYLLWSGGFGLVMALTFYPISFAVITNWFDHKRGKAMALLTLIGGLASPLFLPLAGLLIPSIGWQYTVILCGLLHLLVAAPLHGLLLRRSPEEQGLSPDGQKHRSMYREHKERIRGASVALTLKDASFWMLTMALSLGTLGNMIVFAHQIAYLIDKHYASALAATIAGMLGVASLPGRYLLNVVSGKISAQKMLACCYAIQAVGLLVLITAPSSGWLILYIIAYGGAYGAVSPLRATVMAEKFGRRAYGSITALQGIPIACCAAAGPLMAGWLYDLFQQYDQAFWLCAAGCLLATVGIWFTPSSPTQSL